MSESRKKTVERHVDTHARGEQVAAAIEERKQINDIIWITTVVRLRSACKATRISNMSNETQPLTHHRYLGINDRR
jgi:hypothetical protein